MKVEVRFESLWLRQPRGTVTPRDLFWTQPFIRADNAGRGDRFLEKGD